MWLFTTIVEKLVYVDTLHEWRTTKVQDFKLLDKVWVLRTIEQSEYSHPKNKWKRDKPIQFTSQEWIIIGKASSTLYANPDDDSVIDYEWWKVDKWYSSSLPYRYDNWYKVLLRSGKVIDAHTVKKSHWEFQETFDHMEVMEIKKKNIEASRLEYEKSLQEMSVELEKWKALQAKMYKSIV